MSDDTVYEIHLHFKEPLQVPEAELKDYLDRVPGVRAMKLWRPVISMVEKQMLKETTSHATLSPMITSRMLYQTWMR